ncbi:MAG: exosortase K [Roseburia sp.]|nr:exosortase K [Ruminococcus sp.]MCM1155396.1 exosortase K [Roseburia sp.]MCM1243240.1 exosortase K [Roseburia sp.]
MKHINKQAFKTALKNYWPLCMAAAATSLILYYFSRSKDADMLTWILTPTARWVSILSGISFEYLPHQGYVNHFHQFLIAPSCAGGRFMLLTFLMLNFSFWPFSLQTITSLDEKKDLKKDYLWFGFSIIFAYIATVFVNGIRIVLSIFLPGILEKRHLLNGLLTPDRLHTLIGTVSYFTFLCVIYLLASFIRRRMFMPYAPESAPISDGAFVRFTRHHRLSVPMFWYLLIVLALPLAKRIYLHEWEGFGQYAALILCVCAGMWAVFMIIGKIGERYGK